MSEEMDNYMFAPVIAKRNYCVPATLQMVLEHYNIQGFDQDKIASSLSIVSDDDTVEHVKWGTQIDNDTLNNFFGNNHINLQEKYVPINHFMDGYFMIHRLKELLQNDISIICGYNYTWLFGNREDTYRHVSIIVDVDVMSEKVLLLDPGPKDAGYKYVSAEKLFCAIKAGRDGLWCISKKF